MICRECGKHLPDTYSVNICLECSRENVRKIFRQYPDLGKAFKETLEELKKPENIKTMVDNTVKFIKAIQEVKDGK